MSEELIEPVGHMFPFTGNQGEMRSFAQVRLHGGLTKGHVDAACNLISWPDTVETYYPQSTTFRGTIVGLRTDVKDFCQEQIDEFLVELESHLRQAVRKQSRRIDDIESPSRRRKQKGTYRRPVHRNTH